MIIDRSTFYIFHFGGGGGDELAGAGVDQFALLTGALYPGSAGVM